MKQTTFEKMDLGECFYTKHEGQSLFLMKIPQVKEYQTGEGKNAVSLVKRNSIPVGYLFFCRRNQNCRKLEE